MNTFIAERVTKLQKRFTLFTLFDAEFLPGLFTEIKIRKRKKNRAVEINSPGYKRTLNPNII